jgi:2-methylcitrate dehydratase PrpD
MEIPLTRQLALFCHSLRYETLPPEVVDRAKCFFLDYLAVAVWPEPKLAAVQEAVQRLEAEMNLRDFACPL